MKDAPTAGYKNLQFAIQPQLCRLVNSSTKTYRSQASVRKDKKEPVQAQHWKATNLTFSWLKESILFIAVSKAVTISRNLGSCSQSGLDSKSEEIFTADFDIAVVGTEPRERGILSGTGSCVIFPRSPKRTLFNY